MGSGLKKNNLIFGASGLAKEVCELIISLGVKKNTILFVDVKPGELRVGHENYQIISEEECINRFSFQEVLLYNAIGFPSIRQKVFEKFNGWVFPNVVAKSAILSPTMTIGEGNIFSEGVIITSDVKIGDNNYFNLNVTVGHDTIIADHCVINPGVNISGNVCIGNSYLIGTGATILQNIEVGSCGVLGAGACLTKSVKDDGVVLVGIPAKEINK